MTRSQPMRTAAIACLVGATLRRVVSRSTRAVATHALQEPSPPAPLSPEIEKIHREAFARGNRDYTDPATGFTVFTAYTHLKRGRCCGSRCRHCPYGWQNVKTKPAAMPTTATGDQRGKKSVPYTRTGDSGTSSLFTGTRRSKDDLVFEALGTVDELNSTVGSAHAGVRQVRSSEGVQLLSAQLEVVMSRLLDVGSSVATPRSDNPTQDQLQLTSFAAENVDQLESWIDDITEQLPELDSFVLPTGSDAATRLHIARTVCRRAERRVVALSGSEQQNPGVVRYLNRLSDYLFSAARMVLHLEGKPEFEYSREGGDVQRIVKELEW
eukprot:TRINITY_DN44134_c0_g1_i2.p1 TRINITY_DN44134_c0_g1~~TRINITY_DN44134_c0_g1_i2.p1  ORF type:complete len:325 (-),score=46.86 TRINITY_DN44134_c0_g1_i2:384-1358(-)